MKFIKYLFLGLLLAGVAGCGVQTTPPPVTEPEPAVQVETTPTPVPSTPTPEPTPEALAESTTVSTIETTEEITDAMTAEPTAEAAETAPPIEPGEAGMVTYHTLEMSDGTSLDYAVALPAAFDPAQTYPILLALPPGGQDRAMVQTGLDRYWAAQAIELGWIVLSPAAPDGKLFFQGSERLIPEFLERTATIYRPEGDKYHLGGISNGGISAFRITVNHPELIKSLIVLPGLPHSEEDFEKLELLKDIPVAMFAGEQDTGWVARMEATEEALSNFGGQVSLEIVPNEGHVIQSLDGGEELFALLESFR